MTARMPRTTVALNAQGRLTLPADVRRKLGLREGSQLEVAIDDDKITLRPARVVVAEDAWAYTADHLESVRRALADIREGRVYRLSEAQLLRRPVVHVGRRATRKRKRP